MIFKANCNILKRQKLDLESKKGKERKVKDISGDKITDGFRFGFEYLFALRYVQNHPEQLETQDL